jgi:hypothetical protein
MMYHASKKLTAVHDVVLMEITHCVEHFANDLGCILLGELSVLADTIEKLSSGSKLSDDVVLVLRKCKAQRAKLQERSTHPRLEPIAERNDVRMMQPLQQLQLVVDHLLVTLHVFLEDDLYGDLAGGAVCLPDNTVGTSTLRSRQICARRSQSS